MFFDVRISQSRQQYYKSTEVYSNSKCIWQKAPSVTYCPGSTNDDNQSNDCNCNHETSKLLSTSNEPKTNPTAYKQYNTCMLNKTNAIGVFKR